MLEIFLIFRNDNAIFYYYIGYKLILLSTMSIYLIINFIKIFIKKLID